MSTTAVGKQVRTVTPARSNIFARRQGRKLREALLADLFLFPAFLIIGLFGLFPLLFAAYQSTLVGLNRIVGRYDGLNNYVRAIDNLTYVLFFWLAALLVFMALRSIMQARRTAQEKQWAFWIWAVRAIIGAGFILFVLFIFRALPAVLEVPQLMRRGGPQASFQQLLAQALAAPPIQQALWGALLFIVAGIALHWYIAQALAQRPAPQCHRRFHRRRGHAAVRRLPLWLMDEIQRALQRSPQAGEGLDIWSQIITISAGFLLLFVAWQLWDSASHRQSNAGTALR